MSNFDLVFADFMTWLVTMCWLILCEIHITFKKQDFQKMTFDGSFAQLISLIFLELIVFQE